MRCVSGLIAAIANNVKWCSLVCQSHGVKAATRDSIWVTDQSPPALYPDLITTQSQTSPETVLGLLEGRGACSVKDSFADLDLSADGFMNLFDAQWILIEPKQDAVPNLHWSVIDDAALIGEWERAADLPELLTRELVTEPSVRVLLARRDGVTVGGAIANRSSSVVGVSNVFSTGDAEEVTIWNDVAAAVGKHFPSLPLGGYEHGQSLEAARLAGFSELGPLRIWLRT